MHAALADDEDNIVFEGVGKVDATELKRTDPAGNLFGAKSAEDLFEFVNLSVGVFIALAATETVEFLIIVILDVLANSSKETLLFTHLMLATAARRTGFDDGLLFTAHKLETSGDDAQGDDKDDENDDGHNY